MTKPMTNEERAAEMLKDIIEIKQNRLPFIKVYLVSELNAASDTAKAEAVKAEREYIKWLKSELSRLETERDEWQLISRGMEFAMRKCGCYEEGGECCRT